MWAAPVTCTVTLLNAIQQKADTATAGDVTRRRIPPRARLTGHTARASNAVPRTHWRNARGVRDTVLSFCTVLAIAVGMGQCVGCETQGQTTGLVRFLALPTKCHVRMCTHTQANQGTSASASLSSRGVPWSLHPARAERAVVPARVPKQQQRSLATPGPHN
eukprot:6124035-Prymnesium_polylepis.2